MKKIEMKIQDIKANTIFNKVKTVLDIYYDLIDSENEEDIAIIEVNLSQNAIELISMINTYDILNKENMYNFLNNELNKKITMIEVTDLVKCLKNEINNFKFNDEDYYIKSFDMSSFKKSGSTDLFFDDLDFEPEF